MEEPAAPSKKATPRKAPTKKSAPPKKIAKPETSLGESEAENEAKPGAAEDNSETELSDVIDEEPRPRKKSKSRESQDGKPKKSKAAAAKSKANGDEDPDQVEVKRLQGWLVKCGIRKLWGKELKPYETPKAKIKHLKQMLEEVGMTGRFSQEKASQIKEARELAADIEAVKEGEQRWGRGEEQSPDDEEERPQRRLVRGAKNYDFLSSDGEETD